MTLVLIQKAHHFSGVQPTYNLVTTHTTYSCTISELKMFYPQHYRDSAVLGFLLDDIFKRHLSIFFIGTSVEIELSAFWQNW